MVQVYGIGLDGSVGRVSCVCRACYGANVSLRIKIVKQRVNSIAYNLQTSPSFDSIWFYKNIKFCRIDKFVSSI